MKSEDIQSASSPHGGVRKSFEDMPNEPEAFIFEIFAIIGTYLIAVPGLGYVLRKVGLALAAILEALSPAMPFDVRDNNTFSRDPNKFYGRVVIYTVPITIFFCYGLNIILTWHSGTLFPGSDADRMYFLTDGYNAFLYLFVCPAYVSAAVCLIITVGISWKKLNNYSNAAAAISTSRVKLSSETRLALFFSISMLISGLYIANYISDLANTNLTDKLYWFFDRAKSGERVLNGAGAYYLVMNAILLLITAMAAFCYISMSIEMFRLGKYLKTSAFAPRAGESDVRLVLAGHERELRHTLADFSYCYVLAKILVFVYAINIWVWQISPAGRVANVNSAIIALIIIGMIFLVLPRLYLGSKWHKLKLEFSRAQRIQSETAEFEYEDDEFEYQDVRTKNVQKLAIILDALFGLALGLILFQQYGITGLPDIVHWIWERVSAGR